MDATAVFWFAAFFWFLQQVNDVVNAFLNRTNVPKLYWLSAAASFVSGTALFYLVYMMLAAEIQIIQTVFGS